MTLNAAVWLVLAGSLAGLATWGGRNLEAIVPAQPVDDRPRRLRTAARGVRSCYVLAVVFLLAGLVSAVARSS